MARSRARRHRAHVREWIRIPWWFQLWYLDDNAPGNHTRFYLRGPQSDDVFIVEFIDFQRGPGRPRGPEREHTADGYTWWSVLPGRRQRQWQQEQQEFSGEAAHTSAT